MDTSARDTQVRKLCKYNDDRAKRPTNAKQWRLNYIFYLCVRVYVPCVWVCVCVLQKNPIEALSKDEIISKYKGLLGIAKKAKQAKDGK